MKARCVWLAHGLFHKHALSFGSLFPGPGLAPVLFEAEPVALVLGLNVVHSAFLVEFGNAEDHTDLDAVLPDGQSHVGTCGLLTRLYNRPARGLVHNARAKRASR